MTYKNPIIPGFNPDPSICRVGDDFYLVTSSFEYFPGVPIYHSRDLTNWKHIGYCLTRESQLPLEGCGNSHGIWAATIRHHNGVFYMTTTILNRAGPKRGNFFVTATDPAGEWSEPVFVDFKGIDPSLYFEGGKAYFMTNEGSGKHTLKGSDGIALAEIDVKTGALLSEKKVVWAGSGATCLEGPHLYFHNGWHYMLAAQGAMKSHQVTVGRSRDVFGPYESCPRNPILSHKDYFLSPIQGAGHADLVDDQHGNWWAVFLGTRPTVPGFSHLGRETFLAPVTWGDDGFPVVNGGNLIELEMTVPDRLPAPVAKPKDKNFTDTFDGDKLDLRWNFLRRESKVAYKLDNGLVLQSNGTDISTRGTPTWIGMRQTDFDCEVFCKMKFDFKDAAEFGITVFYDNTRHYDLFVSNSAAGRKVIVKKTFEEMVMVPHCEEYPHDEIVLRMQADNWTYHFGYGKTEEEAKTSDVAKASSRYLSSEIVVEGYTGVFIGIFAQGATQSTAKVEYFKVGTEDSGLRTVPSPKKI